MSEKWMHHKIPNKEQKYFKCSRNSCYRLPLYMMVELDTTKIYTACSRCRDILIQEKAEETLLTYTEDKK